MDPGCKDGDPGTSCNPAFKSLTQWEPRTAAVVDELSDSPSELFTRFAGAEGGASIRWAVYAGFAIEGALSPLHGSGWAPDVSCHRDRDLLAPYRAIAANEIQPVPGAVDVTDLDLPGLRDCYTQAFDENLPQERERRASLQREVRDPDTEIALSPIGGTIGYDWGNERQQLGLSALVLHGWLGRYQKNYAIFSDLLLPYGIHITILTLTARLDTGKLRYCIKWWFAEPAKSYGDKGNIVIDNLRPINAVNFNPHEPLLFKADVHYRSGTDEWVDRDRTLQGIGLITVKEDFDRAAPHLKQTVVLPRPQALTLFMDTPLRVAHVEWLALADPQTRQADRDHPCARPTQACGPGTPRITVTARGEIEEVAGMSYDTRAAETVYLSDIDPDTGAWCAAGHGDQPPLYASRSLTLGDGVVRIDRPLLRDDTFELNARAEHTLRKKIKMRDVGLMQLVLGGDDDFLDNEGTLTLREKLFIHDRQENRNAVSTREQRSEAEVEAIVDFPEFTKGVGEVCAGALSFRLKVAPRSFRASFKKTLDAPPTYDALLRADMGVPGLLVLKDCELRSRSGQAVAFTPGTLAPCGDLLKQVFELLLEKLKGLLGLGQGGKSPFQFDLLSDPFGFLVNLKLPVPRIPFGIGSLENLTFDFRLALAIDISRAGVNCGSLFAFILGDYPVKGFGNLSWLTLPIPDLGMGIFKKLRPPTLTITPFTVRFSTVIAVRVKPPATTSLSIPNPFRSVCFEAVACISGEGGLALAFDIGVANGTVSITLGIVWCPHASYRFDFTPAGAREDHYFSFDEIALVARLELKASVLGVVNIFVRVEAMAQLKLTCSSILTHLEVSGTASIEILFATVDVSFTVNLDPLLGIDPNACPRDKAGPNRLCALPEPVELSRVAVADFFSYAEVAA